LACRDGKARHIPRAILITAVDVRLQSMPPVRVVLVAHHRATVRRRHVSVNPDGNAFASGVPLCLGDRRPSHQGESATPEVDMFQTAPLHMCAEVSESATGHPDQNCHYKRPDEIHITIRSLDHQEDFRPTRTFIRRNGVIFDKADGSKTSTDEQEIYQLFQNKALPKRLSEPCVLSTTHIFMSRRHHRNAEDTKAGSVGREK
jgi:hypothetical protein